MPPSPPPFFSCQTTLPIMMYVYIVWQVEDYFFLWCHTTWIWCKLAQTCLCFDFFLAYMHRLTPCTWLPWLVGMCELWVDLVWFGKHCEMVRTRQYISWHLTDITEDSYVPRSRHLFYFCTTDDLYFCFSICAIKDLYFCFSICTVNNFFINTLY